MTDAMVADSGLDRTTPLATPDAAEAAGEPTTPAMVADDGAGEPSGAAGASVPDTGMPRSMSAWAAGEALAADATMSALSEDRRDGRDAAEAGDGADAGREPAVLEGVTDGAPVTVGTPAEVSPAALVDTLIETAAPRRNKRVRRDAERSNGVLTPEELLIAAVDADGVVEDGARPRTLIAAPPELDAVDSDAWRAAWPDNAVQIVGRLLPRVRDVPVLDGVQRTRMELALVEQLGDAFGIMGTLPIFVMPGAPGFTSIYNEIQRARKQKRRLDPIMVEIHGVLRQMPDRDLRYASERYAVLMGVEAHHIKRVAQNAEQFAYWRGRAQVIASRRYVHQGLPYQRVTAVVALKQRKPRLRGTSLTHIPVDFLVAPDHEHADRFRHIGQHLLIEATIGAAVHHLHEDHPDLAGIDDPRRKAQLRILRESVVTITLGEFPDEEAERDYRAWVTAGRPGPRRPGRTPRTAAGELQSPAGTLPRGQGPRPLPADGDRERQGTLHRGQGRGRLARREGGAGDSGAEGPT